MEALLDVKSAAHLLSLSPWTVRKLISNGQIQPIRLGRRVLVEQAELERLIARRRQGVCASNGQLLNAVNYTE
jgi:excisionase family DNA binding protein